MGHRPGKRTIHAAANRTSTETIVVVLGIGGKDALPGNGTNLSTHRMDAGEAIGTNGQPGNVQEGLGANAAVGRKQNGEETLGNSAKPAWVKPTSVKPDSPTGGRSVPQNNRRPQSCDDGLTSPDSVLSTAEDGLLIIPRTQIRRGPT